MNAELKNEYVNKVVSIVTKSVKSKKYFHDNSEEVPSHDTMVASLKRMLRLMWCEAQGDELTEITTTIYKKLSKNGVVAQMKRDIANHEIRSVF